MVLASIGALLGIIVKVGRAVREELRQKVKAPGPDAMPVLRPASAGW